MEPMVTTSEGARQTGATKASRSVLAWWRGCAKTAAISATSVGGDGPLFLLDYLLRLLRVAVFLGLWRVILAGRGPVEGMDLGALLTYTLIAEALAEPLACRTRFEDALWNGSIAMRFLRPLPLVGELLAEACGRWLFNLAFFSLPLLLVATLLGLSPWPARAGAGALFPLSLALAIAVGLAIDLLFGIAMVSFDLNRWALDQVRGTVTVLLTGAVVPLVLYPWGIGRMLDWLPFAAMASAPLRIYIGVGDPWRLLALQAAWSLMLWPIVGVCWRKSRQKLASYGG